mmetsp:Transcript_4597/g.12551  ORF Transcript_4597/g.12551 Transcript_4597/m.12551 type:complete len:134 (+) Transcript_4597:409-810(+)
MAAKAWAWYHPPSTAEPPYQSKILPVIATPMTPDSVPAVFEMPITTPAYFGAMSIWFTLNPPRAKPNAPKVSVVAAIPGSVSEAMGISINATAELVRPRVFTAFLAAATEKRRFRISKSPTHPPRFEVRNMTK